MGRRASGKVDLLKLVVIGRSRVQIPLDLLVRHGLGPVDAPRGIVVVRLDSWTTCHASTVVDSPSYIKQKVT